MLRRLVPVLRLVRRDLVTIVEERLVDQLGCGTRHPCAEHAGERQRVVRVAAEQLPQLGPVRILVLVEVERADPDVSVAEPGRHPLAHHEGLAERAERFGEHIGRVASASTPESVRRSPNPRTTCCPYSCCPSTISTGRCDGGRSHARPSCRADSQRGGMDRIRPLTGVRERRRNSIPGNPSLVEGSLVGVGRFELPASTSRTWRATKLRYTP